MTVICIILAFYCIITTVCSFILLNRNKAQKKANEKALDALKRRADKVEREWNNFLSYNGDVQP